MVEERVVDGRRRKGERRRCLLLEAAIRLIERGGIGAVTQRGVAQEAEMPPSAVTYYFPTVDDLLVAALTTCNDEYLLALRTIADSDDPLGGLAELIAGSGDRRVQVVAEYELFLLAARRHDLQGELARWVQGLDELVARVVADPVERAGIAAAVDGLLLRCACATDAPNAGEVRAILNRLARRT